MGSGGNIKTKDREETEHHIKNLMVFFFHFHFILFNDRTPTIFIGRETV
jgi:hypothetical protein